MTKNILMNFTNFFGSSDEIKPFLDVINFAIILHSRHFGIIRLVLNIYINLSISLYQAFSVHAFTFILPTILRIYSRSGKLIRKAIEFAHRKFFSLHKKFYILQIFSSVSASINTDAFLTNINTKLKIDSKSFCEFIFSLNDPDEDILKINDDIIPCDEKNFIIFNNDDLEINDNIEYCINLPIIAISSNPKSFQSVSMLLILNELVKFKIDLLVKNKNAQEIEKYQNKLSKYLMVLAVSFDYLNESFSQLGGDKRKGGDQITAQLADPILAPVMKSITEDSDQNLQNRLFLPNLLLNLFSNIYNFLRVNSNMKNSNINIDVLFKMFLNIFQSISNSINIAEMKGLVNFIKDMFDILQFDNQPHQILLNNFVESLILIFKTISTKTVHLESKSWSILVNLLFLLTQTIKKNSSLIIMSNFEEFLNVLLNLLCFQIRNKSISENKIEKFSQGCEEFISWIICLPNSGLNFSNLFFFKDTKKQIQSFEIYERFLAFLVIPLLLKLEQKTQNEDRFLKYCDMEVITRFLITLIQSIMNSHPKAKFAKFSGGNLLDELVMVNSIIPEFCHTDIQPSLDSKKLIFLGTDIFKLALKCIITLHTSTSLRLYNEIAVIIVQYFFIDSGNVFN